MKFLAVYIPVKDMLTHSAGFLAMANKYRDFPFDKTLTDIVIKASQWKVKQPPKLALAILPKIVECLLELSRHGVQIFLSTHNYIFAKYFDVAKSDNDSVLFYSLYFEEKIGGLKCETQPYA